VRDRRLGGAAVNVRGQSLLWLAQRASAMILAVCIIVHLITVIYAVNDGLSAQEILNRTRGNLFWGAFYLVFVGAVAVHAPIGLRAILSEWAHWRGRSLDLGVLAVGVVLAAAGLRAVWAVYA